MKARISMVISGTRVDERPRSIGDYLTKRIAVAVSTLCVGGAIGAAGVAEAGTVARSPLPEAVMAIHRLAIRPVAQATTAAETPAEIAVNSAQGPGPGPIGPGPGCDLFPAPPSVGATVPLTYFGPSPSTFNRSRPLRVWLADPM